MLCTSPSMAALYELVSSRIDYPCLLQGTMSKTGLLEKFEKTDKCRSVCDIQFWQGVDVRGEQLSCVIIDKLPFAVPTDPIVAARQNSSTRTAAGSFSDYSVPKP